jgi:hypothetical protein
MSLLYFESFDAQYELGTLYRWTYNSNFFIVPSGRRGSNCLSVNNCYQYVHYNIGTNESALVIGFAVYPTSGTAGTTFLRIYNTAIELQFVVDCTAAGRVRVKTAADGSVLAQSADGAITFNIYQYFEIKFTCDGTDTVQVRVDGVDVIASTSGLNLRQSGSGGAGGIQFTSLTLGTTHFDDLYILNQSGAQYNNFLGDVKVDAFLPTGDGNYQQFTSTRSTQYDAINDNGNTAITYYIEEDTVGQKDSFTITPTGDLPTIHAISIRSISRNSDTGIAEGTPFIRVGGVDYDQTPFERGDTLEYDDAILTARPDTAGVWTKAILETIEFGFEFSAAS